MSHAAMPRQFFGVVWSCISCISCIHPHLAGDWHYWLKPLTIQKHWDYPLINVYITIENHHFE